MNLQSFIEGLEGTRMLYQEDSYLRKFEAKVVRFYREKKRNFYIVLDKTAFHPKSGGQPSDTGFISGSNFKIKIKKCMLRGDTVIHYGKLVEGDNHLEDIIGEIDWSWRYLLMRKHTAGHLLDHCLSEVCGEYLKTLDSWLGDPCYVSYKGEIPQEYEIKKAEKMENELIKQGRPVSIEHVCFEELLRRSPNAPNIFRLPKLEKYRIVTIQGFEPIPCGGTHLKNINEVGRFKIVKVIPNSGSFRVYYDVY